jgi:hypothetical protein
LAPNDRVRRTRLSKPGLTFRLVRPERRSPFSADVRSHLTAPGAQARMCFAIAPVVLSGALVIGLAVGRALHRYRDFKMVNDELGHRAGDLILSAIAKRLSDCMRPSDTGGRFGGAESSSYARTSLMTTTQQRGSPSGSSVSCAGPSGRRSETAACLPASASPRATFAASWRAYAARRRENPPGPAHLSDRSYPFS